jgi:N-methylhydantoinase B
MAAEPIVHRVGKGASSGAVDADPIRTEVIRHGLNSAAEQIKRALVRTAFSPIIYEVLDFAVAIYDHRVRLLAQAPSLPIFMGTLSFCVEAAVEAVGGEQALAPGDVLLYNLPYGTGSHPQDCAMVMPVFLGPELLGYTVVKSHWLDIAGKDPYSTDTIDVYQEGTVYPGVKLYRAGQRVEDVYRVVLANTRVPKMVAGDVDANLVGLRTGAVAFVEVVERYGLETFRESVERMFDHGEAIMRSYLEQLPDGRYTGHGVIDDNGVEPDEIPFEVHFTIDGSDVVVDYSDAPPAQAGPMNCPLPSTVSGSRIALTMLAGGGDAPNEGHFRPISVRTRPGTMFHPESPSPCFLYAWPTFQAIEAIYGAVAQALPAAVPACSGGDICALSWWGRRERSGEPWVDGAPHPVGQGAHRGGDGASSLLHIGESATRFAPAEVWEARNPWLMERVELAPDSGGAGRHRGGLGVDFHFRALEDCWLTSAIERTKHGGWGIEGGREGRPNASSLRLPDGTRRSLTKVTRLRVPKGATFELSTGGVGGYGEPSERDAEAVRRDVREGYVSEAAARRDYPHAFVDSPPAD